MLSLKLGKTYLDLDAKASISIQATTPLTDTDNVGRAFSFDFELPDSPTNIAALGHPNRLEKSPQKTEEAKIMLENLPYLKGKLSIIDIKKTIKTSFANKERNILDELDYDLSTFAQETIQLHTDGSVVGITLGWRLDFLTQAFVDNVPNVCSIIINGHRFSKTFYNWNAATQTTNITIEGTELANDINVFFGSNIATYNSSWRSIFIEKNEMVTFVVENKISVTPLFSIHEYDHQRIVVGVQSLIDNPNSGVIFPMIYAPNFYPDNAVFKYVPFVNYQTAPFILRNEWTPIQSNFRNSLAPGVKLKYILLKIANRLKLKLDGDWWSETDAQNLFFWTGATLDEFVEEGTPLSNPTTKQYLNKWKKSFKLGDFMPKMTAKELLSALSEMFGIYYKVSGTRLLLLKKRSLYAQKSHDWTSFLIPGSLRIEPYNNKGVKFSYDFPSDIDKPNDQLLPYQIGEETDTINYNLKFVTLPMTKFIYSLPHFWGAAETEVNAVLIHRPEVAYVKGASDDKDEYGEVISGAWSLNFEGNTGLYKKHLKNIAELQVAPNASALFDLPTQEITALQRGDFVRIHAHTPDGTLRAVIKTIKIKPSVRDLGFAEVEMLRI